MKDRSIKSVCYVNLEIKHGESWFDRLNRRFQGLEIEIFSIRRTINGNNFLTIGLYGGHLEEAKKFLIRLGFFENIDFETNFTQIQRKNDVMLVLGGVCNSKIECEILDIISKNGSFPEWPIFVCDGKEKWNIISIKREFANAIYSELRKKYDVTLSKCKKFHSIQDVSDLNKLSIIKDLTKKQKKSLILVSDRGYYSIPRLKNLKYISQQFGIKHSTLSEMLRRAENTVLSSVIELIKKYESLEHV